MRAQPGGRAQVRRDVRGWGQQSPLGKGREAPPQRDWYCSAALGAFSPWFSGYAEPKRHVLQIENDSTVITFVIVIVIIPIPLGVPAVVIFTPPTMAVVPAMLTGFAQFVTPVVCLLALVAMMFDCFVQVVVGFGNAALAIVVGGAQTRQIRKHEKGSQRGRGSERPSPKE
jgi:hypothetical protein